MKKIGRWSGLGPLVKAVGTNCLNRVKAPRGPISSLLGRKSYSVLLDTTNGCNLQCVFCTRENGKVVMMSPRELEVILDKVARFTDTLQLSCAWEYSIDRNAPELVRTLGNHRIRSTSIYTNGNILSEELARALVAARMGQWVVSIGEAREETYRRLRAGGDFAKVIANIERLVAIKKELGSQLPLICANLTLVKSNLDELPEFVELAHRIGVQRIVGRQLILNEGLDMSCEVVTAFSHADQVIDAAERKAKDYGMHFSVPRYRGELLPKSCQAPWRQLYISSNGDVSVCPRIHVYSPLGNLLKQSLREILRGRPMKELREQFKAGCFTNPVCGICMENRETVQAINQGF